MTPFEIVNAEYAQRPEITGNRPFAWFVARYGAHGFTFDRPDCFLMGRPVVRSAPPEQIIQWDYDFDWGRCDAWYVQAAAGNVGKAVSLMPWPLPWVGFVRIFRGDSSLRFYATGSLKRLLTPRQSLPP